MLDVLLLDVDYRPVRVLDWQRAVGMLLDEKVRSVVAYAGRSLRSASLELDWPAVVSLVERARGRSRPRLQRANLLARDHWTCQYCGLSPRTPKGLPDTSRLTLDHVVPRCRALRGQVRGVQGVVVPVSSWENLVAACRPCNARKADRTPDEARMPLRRPPRRPGPTEAARLMLGRVRVPPEWRDFLPEDWQQAA
jgi:5-methylcytosine-specific restriction endonuclease McrA